jgi:hypothetical protein
MTTTAQLYHITTDIIKKLQVEGMTEAEIYEFRRLMYKEEIKPSRMILVPSMCERLNAIGLSNSFTMGRNPDDVVWKLSKNGLSNYIEKNRTDTIKELLS